MKVYIAGPIKGMPDGNRAAFKQRAEELLLLGHLPVNPWDIPPDHDIGECIGDPVDHSDSPHRYGCYLRADIEQLMYCDAITMLPGWENSVGACTELGVAMAIGLLTIKEWTF